MELKCIVCGKELTGLQKMYCSRICKNRSPKAKELIRLYYQRPEVKEKQRLYHQRPEVKKRSKERLRLYRQRLEVKEKMRLYRQRPEVKARRKKWNKENKENLDRQRKIRRKTPKVKKQMKRAKERYKKRHPEKYVNAYERKSLRIMLNRNKIFHFYNHECVRCGFKEVLDIHHINGNGRKDSLFNLPLKEYLVLCPNCRALVTRGYLTKNLHE